MPPRNPRSAAAKWRCSPANGSSGGCDATRGGRGGRDRRPTRPGRTPWSLPGVGSGVGGCGDLPDTGQAQTCTKQGVDLTNAPRGLQRMRQWSGCPPDLQDERSKGERTHPQRLGFSLPCKLDKYPSLYQCWSRIQQLFLFYYVLFLRYVLL